MPKVTMTLTDQDVANADEIFALAKARSKAHAVSIALSLCRFIIDALRQPGTQLLLRDSQGNLERIVMPELQPRLPRDVAEAKPRAKGAAAPAYGNL